MQSSMRTPASLARLVRTTTLSPIASIIPSLSFLSIAWDNSPDSSYNLINCVLTSPCSYIPLSLAHSLINSNWS